jgi:hypothetical protein
MSNCDYNTCFKGINNISEDLLLNIVEANFKMYFDWSFLNIGAWFDAKISNSTLYGINYPYRLIPVNDPAYADGRVWQGIRKDWVWESSATYGETSPTVVSSALINGTTTVNKSGNFSVNYPLGRIIFNSPISLSSTVDVEHSYRFVQTHRASESPWFNILQYQSFKTSNVDIQRSEDGEWSIGANHRIQLPAIVIESVPRSRSRPYELGNSLLWLEQDIAFYVYAETKNDRNKLLDIIRLQQDLTIQLYDTNIVAQNDVFPLDYNGDIKNSPLMYPDIVQTYPWRKCFIKNINLFEIDSPHPNFHQGMARATVEIISS